MSKHEEAIKYIEHLRSIGINPTTQSTDHIYNNGLVFIEPDNEPWIEGQVQDKEKFTFLTIGHFTPFMTQVFNTGDGTTGISPWTTTTFPHNDSYGSTTTAVDASRFHYTTTNTI